MQIQSSCCAFAALQEDGSVISWGHPSMPQKTAEIAESMIFCYFLADFPHLFLGNPWKSTRKPLGNGWIPGRLCFFFGGFLDQQNPRTTAERLMLSAARQNPVTAIQLSSHAFAALSRDRSVTTWGNKDYGGDPWNSWNSWFSMG